MSEKSERITSFTVSLLEKVRRESRLPKDGKRDYEAFLEVVLIQGVKILFAARDAHGDPMKDVDQIMREGHPAYDAMIRRLYEKPLSECPREV